MTDRKQLEQMCRESFKKLSRAERALGINSPEANMFRAEWCAFDKAYRLVFKERLDYFNNTKLYEP